MFTPAADGGTDLTTLRRDTVADALRAGLRRGGGAAVDGRAAVDGGTSNGAGALRHRGAVDGATVDRWARWLIGQLDAAGSIYQRSGEGWRLRTGALHEESERRLDELSGWSSAAVAEQRKLLEHVDDPGDDGTDLEQSLSKLAAAGWSVDSKKDKGPPAIHFAAGDLPLAAAEDWRAAGAVHPRLAAALAFFLAALPAAEREGAEPGDFAGLAEGLPATAIARADDAAALLDVRTVAKALRDAGALQLESGEPLGTVVAVAPFRLRRAAAKPSSADHPTAGDAAAAAADHPTAGDAAGAAAAAAGDPNDVGALAAAYGEDAVRFALLHAAAPTKRFRGGDDVVGYAAGFLEGARALAAGRLDGSAGERIDTADPLRRRLAGWCDVAAARSAENHRQLEPHRATRNAITLLARIEDFDAAAAAARGDRDADADREAVGVALTVLARLLAPLAPDAAEDLWRRAGRAGTPADAPWPEPQRTPAAAA